MLVEEVGSGHLSEATATNYYDIGMSGNIVVVSSRRFTQVSTAHFLAKSDSLMGVSEIIWCPVIGTALYIYVCMSFCEGVCVSLTDSQCTSGNQDSFTLIIIIHVHVHKQITFATI